MVGPLRNPVKRNLLQARWDRVPCQMAESQARKTLRLRVAHVGDSGWESPIRALFQMASGLSPHGRQAAPYSPELNPDIVLTQPQACSVDETLHALW